MMIELLFILLLLIFPLTVFYQTYVYQKERKELLDRLMAKSYAEYEAYQKIPPDKKKPSEETNFLQKSIRNAYREQRGPFDDEEAIKSLEEGDHR